MERRYSPLIAVIGVGGSDAWCSLCAVCRYVIALRRSPPESRRMSSSTPGSASTPSLFAIISMRACDELCSSGRKRNLEHRDATGSMILKSAPTPILDSTPFLQQHNMFEEGVG